MAMEQLKWMQNIKTMKTDSKIVALATEELGYKETPANTNKTKFGEWFGLDGLPWCAMFVSWIYAHAGKPLPNIGFAKGFASCQLGAEYFRKHGNVTTTPVSGDIVLFDWNADGRYDHTGIYVRNIDAARFESIEGNTAMNNQSNGGEVMLRRRYKKNAIFIHID